jgi:hypothetical protein
LPRGWIKVKIDQLGWHAFAIYVPDVSQMFFRIHFNMSKEVAKCLGLVATAVCMAAGQVFS